MTNLVATVRCPSCGTSFCNTGCSNVNKGQTYCYNCRMKGVVPATSNEGCFSSASLVVEGTNVRIDGGCEGYWYIKTYKPTPVATSKSISIAGLASGTYTAVLYTQTYAKNITLTI